MEEKKGKWLCRPKFLTVPILGNVKDKVCIDWTPEMVLSGKEDFYPDEESCLRSCEKLPSLPHIAPVYTSIYSYLPMSSIASTAVLSKGSKSSIPIFEDEKKRAIEIINLYQATLSNYRVKSGELTKLLQNTNTYEYAKRRFLEGKLSDEAEKLNSVVKQLCSRIADYKGKFYKDQIFDTIFNSIKNLRPTIHMNDPNDKINWFGLRVLDCIVTSKWKLSMNRLGELIKRVFLSHSYPNHVVNYYNELPESEKDTNVEFDILNGVFSNNTLPTGDLIISGRLRENIPSIVELYRAGSPDYYTHFRYLIDHDLLLPSDVKDDIIWKKFLSKLAMPIRNHETKQYADEIINLFKNPLFADWLEYLGISLTPEGLQVPDELASLSSSLFKAIPPPWSYSLVAALIATIPPLTPEEESKFEPATLRGTGIMPAKTTVFNWGPGKVGVLSTPERELSYLEMISLE